MVDGHDNKDEPVSEISSTDTECHQLTPSSPRTDTEAPG